MKRFHVHMHVEDLAKNIAFYSAMAKPAAGSCCAKAEPVAQQARAAEPAKACC
jgi:hypothetical protein